MCKLCGGDIIKKYTESSKYEVRVDKNGEEIEEAEYIEGGDFYEELFECEDCKEYIENFQNIEEIADWVEKELL